MSEAEPLALGMPGTTRRSRGGAEGQISAEGDVELIRPKRACQAGRYCPATLQGNRPDKPCGQAQGLGLLSASGIEARRGETGFAGLFELSVKESLVKEKTPHFREFGPKIGTKPAVHRKNQRSSHKPSSTLMRRGNSSLECHRNAAHDSRDWLSEPASVESAKQFGRLLSGMGRFEAMGFLREMRWRKERHLAWFHKVTSEFSEEQILSACATAGIEVAGRSMRELQTELLQADENVVSKFFNA